MADYVAIFKNGPDRPVVTHSSNGIAMIYDDFGTLIEAPRLPGFYRVQPYKQVWIVDSVGLPIIRSISEE